MRRKILLLTFGVLCWSLTLVAQNTVTGTITNSDGEPLIGVNIVEKGTATGTSSDLDGNYSVTVSGADAVLVFSYTGFETQELTVGTQSSINVTLSEGLQLEEVVVTALGFEVRTNKLGSAVSSVNAADIARSGETSVTNSIQGRMAGVNITRSNGDPGAGSNIRIIKIVKYFFKSLSENKRVSRYLPENNNQNIIFELKEKKPILPSEKEINENPPSRSAKLRYVKKSVEIYDIKTDILDKFRNLLDVEKIGESL